jgi:hypothetical protein
MEVSTYKKPVKVVVETDTQTNEKSLGKKNMYFSRQKDKEEETKKNRQTNTTIVLNNFWQKVKRNNGQRDRRTRE